MKYSYHSMFKLSNFVASKLLDKSLVPVLSIVNKQYFSVAPDSVLKREETEGKHPVVENQTFFLSNIISENSVVDWKALEEDTLKLKGPLNKRNIGGKILDICTALKNFDAGKSFLNHLKSSNVPLSLAVSLMYFKLCHKCKDVLTQSDRQELLSMYENIASKHKMLLEGTVAESVIVGVSLTDKWEEGFKYLEIAKEAGSPGLLTYIALIEAAVYHNKFDTALKVIEEYSLTDRYLPSSLYNLFITQCVKLEQASYVESIFHLISRYTAIPDSSFAEIILDLCSKNQIPFEGTDTSISKNGCCQKCLKPLGQIQHTKEQYDELRSALLNNSLIGLNIFTKTNPKELDTFLEFIKKSAPFDVIIDGLNTAYLQNTPKYSKAFMLKKVVEEFAKKKQKILVLGRKHMKRWKDSEMRYIFNHCTCFFVDDSSSDDQFLLYAALYSGLGTNFVSRDFMRSHKALLGTVELKKTFKLWQQAHQIFPEFVSNAFVTFKYPTKYYQIPHQLSNGTWHIPYTSCKSMPSNFVNHYQKEDFLWLCLTPAGNKSAKL